jgi:hypothetical protein
MRNLKIDTTAEVDIKVMQTNRLIKNALSRPVVTARVEQSPNPRTKTGFSGKIDSQIFFQKFINYFKT